MSCHASLQLISVSPLSAQKMFHNLYLFFSFFFQILHTGVSMCSVWCVCVYFTSCFYIYLFSQALPCCSVACQGCTHLHSFLCRAFLVSCSCDGPAFFFFLHVIRKQWQRKFSDAACRIKQLHFSTSYFAVISTKDRKKKMLVKSEKISAQRKNKKLRDTYLVLFFQAFI